jgi:hypothetical protein
MARILLRLLILAIVLGVFLLVRDSLKDDPLELQNSSTPRIVSEQEIVPDLTSAPALNLERETVDVVPIRQPQLGTPVEDGLEVQVVDMESEEPVANAFVLVMDMERMEEDAETMPSLHKLGMEILIQRYGIQYPTDKEGRTTIPRGNEKRLFLAGKAEGAFGVRNANADSEELILIPIGKTSVLYAHVVDSNGAPAADVSVFIVTVTSSRRNPFLEAKTDAQGLAELRIPAAYLREIPEGLHILVEAEAFSIFNASVDVDLHQLPSEPVELRLPPSGKVRVLVTGIDGKPYEGMCSVRFALDNHASHEGPVDSLRYDAKSTRRQFVGGETVFDNVGLETELWVQASNRDGSFIATAMPIGPTSEGQVVDVHLALAPVRPVIVGQILDLEGKSVGRSKMKISVEERRRNGNGFSSTTFKCDDGRFRHILQQPSPKPGSLRSLVVRYEGDKQGIRGEARFDLNRTFSNGETDIGQIQLQPLPLVVSGQVVDSDGQGVADASWFIQRQVIDEDGNPVDHWLNENGSSGAADGEGIFQLLKYLESGSYQITATAPGYTATRVPFQIGQENLQLVLGGAQDIIGQILVDEGISLEAMSLGISQKSEQQTMMLVSPGGPGGSIAADGSFTFADKSTDTYEIKLTCPRTGEALMDPLEVYVDAAAAVAPVIIDLRGQLTQMLIHVVDEQGVPIVRNYLCVPDIAVTRLGYGEATKTVITRNAGMIVQVSADKKRTVSLPIVRGEETVVLKEGYPIEIEVTNLEVVPDGYFLAGQLMRAGPDGGASGSLWLGESFAFPDGAASVACHESGDLFVQLKLIENPEKEASHLSRSLFGGRRIRSNTYHTSSLVVPDVEGRQKFLISIDEDELEATMEYWRMVQKR